ncbi:DUF4190 domain-containing protein [Microbacterium sp. KR10-403]|uniref:DUF4190 domain-containing protein n=1 Tax=Microbacterium sp. KR10-403 TaxID=3158581 RepID=UPI0032E4150E
MSTPHDPNTPAGAVPPVPPAPAAPDAPAPASAPTTPPPAPAAYPQGYAQPYAQGQPGAYAPVPPSGYGQPVPGLPPQPDNRPKTLALVALILAVVGFIAACVGFAPIGLIFVIVGGVLLAAAFVLSIVVLASRKQGGKGLGIAGLVVSVVGGIVFGFALTVSIAWMLIGTVNSAVESATSPSSAVSAPADDSTTDDSATDDNAAPADGTYDEDAYLADVRPKIRAVFKEIEPSVDDATIDAAYSDDTLVFLGSTLLNEYNSLGDDVIATEAETLVSSSGDMFSQEQAESFMRDILESAQKYLVEQ